MVTLRSHSGGTIGLAANLNIPTDVSIPLGANARLVDESQPQLFGTDEAVSDPIGASLKTALERFEEFLADSLDAVIDPVIDEAAEQVICPLYDDLNIAYQTARANRDTRADFKAQLPARVAFYIYNTGAPGFSTQLRAQLEKPSDIFEQAGGFIEDFNDMVGQAITEVDGFQEIMAKPATRAIPFFKDLGQQNGIDSVGGTDKLNGYFDLFEEFDMAAFVSTIMKELSSETVGAFEDKINPLIGEVNEYTGAAEIKGYAEFNGDSLRQIRLDASMQFKISDEMQLNVFLEIYSYTSEDENTFMGNGDKAAEVTVGALNVPFDWISEGLKASLSVKISLKDEGSGLKPNGVGGSFEIGCFKVTMAVGLDECYLGARACGFFNILAGVGAGVGFFVDDSLSPVFVGKMFAGISGESLCVVSIKGAVTLVAPLLGQAVDPLVYTVGSSRTPSGSIFTV
ncbi:MAG: hypothetical protein ACJAQT_002337 [Akkermansiaceae bacterium]|jgi:hypothetical protein